MIKRNCAPTRLCIHHRIVPWKTGSLLAYLGMTNVAVSIVLELTRAEGSVLAVNVARFFSINLAGITNESVSQRKPPQIQGKRPTYIDFFFSRCHIRSFSKPLFLQALELLDEYGIRLQKCCRIRLVILRHRTRVVHIRVHFPMGLSLSLGGFYIRASFRASGNDGFASQRVRIRFHGRRKAGKVPILQESCCVKGNC